jgi:virulence factor Mce-like protein
VTSARFRPPARLTRRVGAIAAIAVLAAGVVVLVDLADGDFASTYQVVGMFPSAGQGLHAGSEVDERGVQIGSVASITLDRGRARVVLTIHDQYRLPADVAATIRSQNLFGADAVVVSSPAPVAGAQQTYLAAGGTIRETGTEDDLGQLFASAAPLLEKVDTSDLAAIVSELAEAASGEGPAIAASLDEGTKFATLLASTRTAQLQALDAFSRFSAATAPLGPSINAISSDNNVTLPLFTRAAGAYQALLVNLASLSDRVSALVTGYQPDIATILESGGNISRLLVADQPEVEYLVYGLAQYAYRFGTAAAPAKLPDGSSFGFFRTFVEWSDVEQLVCQLIAPAVPGTSFLAPLQQLVASSGTPLDCSSEIAAARAAQVGTPASQVPVTPHANTGAAAPTSAVSGLTTTAGKLLQQLYQELASPQVLPATSTTVGSYVQSLLGAP